MTFCLWRCFSFNIVSTKKKNDITRRLGEEEEEILSHLSTKSSSNHQFYATVNLRIFLCKGSNLLADSRWENWNMGKNDSRRLGNSVWLSMIVSSSRRAKRADWPKGPVGVLLCRLLHRNGNFVPLAP